MASAIPAESGVFWEKEINEKGQQLDMMEKIMDWFGAADYSIRTSHPQPNNLIAHAGSPQRWIQLDDGDGNTCWKWSDLRKGNEKGQQLDTMAKIMDWFGATRYLIRTSPPEPNNSIAHAVPSTMNTTRWWRRQYLLKVECFKKRKLMKKGISWIWWQK